MNTAMWFCILLPLFLVLVAESSMGRMRFTRRQRRRRVRTDMNELIQQFLGKKCILRVGGGWGGDLTGIIESVEGNWVSVRTANNMELVNLDFINRISEVTEKKKK